MNYKLYKDSLNNTEQVIETILLNRGIKDPEIYLNLDASCCNDYENLNNINDAIEEFDFHFCNRHPIAILVDEDLDGFCSSACIYNYIKRLDKTYPVDYILHKYNKTHGLSKMNEGDFQLPDDVKLFIIPDAGTNDINQLNELTRKGISCIVLDHHQQEYKGENCNAIIINNQISDKYTDKEFCGTGILFEFLRALDDYYLYDYANDYLDLVAFANIADVMSMKNFQTRYYVNQGLENIQNKFLLAIMKAQEFSTKGIWNIFNVAWYLVPPINSMIRIGSLEDKDILFRAFIETDEAFPYKKRGSDTIVDEDIYTRAARLCKNAKSRQDKMRDSLCEKLKEDVNSEDKVVMLVAPQNADPGIIGLAAMKLADWTGRPCILLRDQGDGYFSGSCRNCNNSPVKDFKELVNSTRMFEFAQGHPGAFGCAIYEENLLDAHDMLNDALENIEYDDTIYCDFILDVNDITMDFVYAIDGSKWIYGNGIDEPMIALENVEVCLEDCMIMGKNADSVAFMFGGIKYCKFKCKENDDLLDFANGYIARELTLNVVGKLSINEYRGQSTTQFIIEDYEITSMS